MSIVVCWFQLTLKQLEREQTDTQDNYSNRRTCAPRVNKNDMCTIVGFWHCRFVVMICTFTSFIHYLNIGRSTVTKLWQLLHTCVTSLKKGNHPSGRVLFGGAVAFLWERERISNDDAIRYVLRDHTLLLPQASLYIYISY